jgi:hypothetical protein
MGSFSPTIANNPTTQNRGKGGSIGSGPRGDFGDPNFDNAEPMPYRFRGMADQLMGGQFTQGPSNNGQFDPTEGGGLSGIPNTQQYAQPTGGPPVNQQFRGKNGMSTNSATSGQPQMGNPQDQEDMYQPQRRFPNTIQPWDNAQIKTQSNSGKGKR